MIKTANVGRPQNTISILPLALAFSAMTLSLTTYAQGEDAEFDEAALDLEEIKIDVNLRNYLNINEEDQASPLIFYGYVRANAEKVFAIPDIDANGSTTKTDSPLEWSNPNFHLFGFSKVNEYIDIEFNLFGADSDFEVRTAWGNLRYNDLIQLKVGKQYRRFGLFNEKLDHIPIFMGIEPPELLDQDHLLLPRTTQLSFHGEFAFANGTISYLLDTDNPESGPAHGAHPLGYDLRYKNSSVLFGISGYESSYGTTGTQSTVDLGNGSPRGGVLPWMSSDKYNVFGAYLETAIAGFIVQTAFWQASHNAERDPASVLTLVREAGINPAQRTRFLGANAGKNNADLQASDVAGNGDYDVETAYFRVGYPFYYKVGTFTPYFHWDWMDNPEAIRNKNYGGDNETGFADNGEFSKYSVGLVYNPINGIAVKLDSSMHEQEFNGRTERYPEIRLDFSFTFKM